MLPQIVDFFLCLNSNSDDNLLKNIELFDKLVLRFNGRVLFVKDVLGDEICCWSFYGEGRKIAEVCCTSIVYATEKKQTKVSVMWGDYFFKGNIEHVGVWLWLSLGLLAILIDNKYPLPLSRCCILPLIQKYRCGTSQMPK